MEAKSGPKSTKNWFQNDVKNKSKKIVKKIAQGCARRRGGVPIKGPNRPFGQTVVDTRSLHFVPQGHGGGYIHMYIDECVYICIYLCVYIYICMYMYICVYIYVSATVPLWHEVEC